MASSESSSSSSTLAGVCVPVYDLAPGRICRAVEHASPLAKEFADDHFDFCRSFDLR
jgi:hypothetical protein